MLKITLETGDMTNFSGDAIIVPSDVELSYSKTTLNIKRILQKAGGGLLEELAAIGYAEVGNAVITNGYKLKVKHLIFMPFTCHQEAENKISSTQFHQSLKSAFTLAKIYKVKTLAIPLLPRQAQKKNPLEKLVDILFGGKFEAHIKADEMMDIITAIARENKSVLEKVAVYR